jgi:hypothetical protein
MKAALMLPQDGATVPDLSENGIHLEAFASYSTLLIKAHQLYALPLWCRGAVVCCLLVVWFNGG